MSNHFIGAARGNIGLRDNQFTYGTSSTSTLDFELRIADLDQNSHAPTRQDIALFLEAVADFLTGPSNITGTKFPII